MSKRLNQYTVHVEADPLRRVLRFLLVDHDMNLSETFPMAHNTMKAETTTLEGRVAGRRSDGVAGPVRLE